MVIFTSALGYLAIKPSLKVWLILLVLLEAAICILVSCGSWSGTAKVFGTGADCVMRKALAGSDNPTKDSSTANVITELCCLCNISGLNIL